MVRASEWIDEQYPEYAYNTQPTSLDLELSRIAYIYDWPLHYRIRWWWATIVHALLGHINGPIWEWPTFQYFQVAQIVNLTKFAKRKRQVDIRTGYWLKPGEMALLSSREYIKIPNDAVAFLALKSSRAREGLNHGFAGFCDAGFEGNIVFEVYSHCHPTFITEGLPLAQLVFMQSEEPAVPYHGHYQGQKGPTISWTEGG